MGTPFNVIYRLDDTTSCQVTMIGDCVESKHFAYVAYLLQKQAEMLENVEDLQQLSLDLIDAEIEQELHSLTEASNDS